MPRLFSRASLTASSIVSRRVTGAACGAPACAPGAAWARSVGATLKSRRRAAADCAETDAGVPRMVSAVAPRPGKSQEKTDFVPIVSSYSELHPKTVRPGQRFSGANPRPEEDARYT